MRAVVSLSAFELHDVLTRALAFARVCNIEVDRVRADRTDAGDFRLTLAVEAPAPALDLFERRIAGTVGVTGAVRRDNEASPTLAQRGGTTAWA